MKDQHIDYIFVTTDGLLKAGKYEAVDALLGEVVRYEYIHNKTTALALLTITAPAKSRLSNREDLFEVATGICTDDELKGLE